MNKYTLYSGILTHDQWLDIFSNISEFLRELFKEEILIVQYGWACNIHNDLQYVPMRTGKNWIMEFITDSISRKIYEIGKSDLIIENNKTELLFCHESDFHITTETREELETIQEIKIIKKYLIKPSIQEIEDKKKC